MEKKQLNFSAPLMSARRYSSPIRSSGEDQKRVSPMVNQNLVCQKSELSSAEVVKPVSVPFMWEQTPGRAKGRSQLKLTSPEEHPSIPKLPPGRTSKSGELNGFRNLNKLSGELAVLRPRHKLSGELTGLRSHYLSGELSSLRPNNKFSGELNTLNRFYSLNEGMVRWGSSKEETEMSASSESRDENDDGTFSDVHDTVSQFGSFSVNCSISGLNGSVQPNAKPRGIISTDRKPQDFMMDRFLPAAKAMTLEPSQYASRKKLVGVEKPEVVKVLVPRAMTLPPRQNMCNTVPYKGQDIGSEKCEEDEDRYDEQSTLSVQIKACGFLPRFFSKKSLCLKNKLPSLQSTSKSALSSASKITGLLKINSWKSSSPKLTKHDPCGNHRQKPNQGFKSCELQMPKCPSRPMFYSGELQTRSGSPYRSSRQSSLSPYRSDSPNSVYHKGVGFISVMKQVNPNDHNRPKIHQKSRPIQLPKSETAFGYGGHLELMRARGMSSPLVCGALDANVPSKGSGYGSTDLVVANDSAAVQSAFTPPMPKSPSESWLSRRLSSVLPRNSVSHSSLNSKLHSSKQTAKNSTSGAKWETIVKSSHLCLGHGWDAEELVTHVPQRPQTWK